MVKLPLLLDSHTGAVTRMPKLQKTFDTIDALSRFTDPLQSLPGLKGMHDSLNSLRKAYGPLGKLNFFSESYSSMSTLGEMRSSFDSLMKAYDPLGSFAVLGDPSRSLSGFRGIQESLDSLQKAFMAFATADAAWHKKIARVKPPTKSEKIKIDHESVIESLNDVSSEIAEITDNQIQAAYVLAGNYLNAEPEKIESDRQIIESLPEPAKRLLTYIFFLILSTIAGLL